MVHKSIEYGHTKGDRHLIHKSIEYGHARGDDICSQMFLYVDSQMWLLML